MTINTVSDNTTYKVENVLGDEKINNFLRTLGLFRGEQITLIAKTGTNFILNIKDGRYAIDKFLASKIVVAKI